MFNFVKNLTIGNIKHIMKKLFLVLVILSFVENTMAQLKMAQFPEKEKKEVIFTYDSLTNVKSVHSREFADKYRHLIGQKITSITSSDESAFIKVNNERDGWKNSEHLKNLDGTTFYVDSINYEHIDGYVFYVHSENNPYNRFSLTVDEKYLWKIDLAWISNGYFEKIKQLYLGKELVYIHQDNEDDIREYTHFQDRFMNYNTRRNLAKKIPCNSVWKCTDILVLPGKLSFGDCDNRVILNIENEEYGKYYIFAAELLELKERSKIKGLGFKEKFLTMEEFHRYQSVQNQLRAAAKAKAEKAAAEKALRESERRNNIITKYGSSVGNMILRGEIMIGMSKQQCLEALGFPQRINRTITATMVYEQWVYDSKYVYFENDKLVTIQD